MTTFSFSTEDPSVAAQIFELLSGESWPDADAGKAAASKDEERPPWEADDKPARPAARRAEKPADDTDDDPWASSKPASSRSSGGRSGGSSAKSASTVAGTDFPAEGEYEKQAKSGLQVWTFGTRNAPTCDCGHAAAQIEGYKGKDQRRGKPWVAYWCPVGFGKAWKQKCEFSEFA